jgi:tetratricopeptide (TPR) repeat protein
MDPSTFFDPVYALTVTTRIAQRSPEEKTVLAKALEGRLSHLVDAALAVAVETGEPMGAALAECFAEEGSDELAERLSRRLSESPYFHAWPLHPLGLQATGRFLEACRQAWTRPSRRQRAVLAGLSHNHGRRLLLLGRPAEALPFLDEALTLYDSQGIKAVSDRIQCLGTRSEALTQLGRISEALAAAEEAAAAGRATLPGKGPHARLASARLSLAGHLINLCGCLADVERHAEALAVIEEAVALFEQHRAIEGHTQAYARALLCRGNELYHLGRYEEATQALEGAIDLSRELETDQATAFEPDLALALADLALLYEQSGRLEDARHTLGEAVERYRRLEDRYPESFRPSLAWSLSLLSPGAQTAQASLRARTEAVERYRRLAERQPAVYEPQLGRSLFDQSESLLAAGELRAALTAANEAVLRLRRCVTERRALAWSLLLRARTRSALGHRRKAVADSRAAVQIFRQRGAQQAAFYATDLAVALHVLGTHLHYLGRFPKAIEVTREAEEIYRRLAVASPQVFTEDLASCLNSLSHHLYEAGHREESITATQKSIDLYRSFLAELPGVGAGLAASLSNLAPRLGELGRPEEALEAALEAVDLYSRYDDQPEGMATALHALGVAYLDLDQPAEALPFLRQAVRLRRHLAAQQPEVHDVDLACSLTSFGKCWSDQGDYRKALTATRRGILLLRQAVQRGDEFLHPRLAASLSNQAHQLCELGKPRAALKAAHEAVKLLNPYFQAQSDRYLPWITAALGHYLRAAEEAGVEADLGLVGEIAMVFARSGLSE